MHHVVCATSNPAKIKAILHAFHEIFGEGSCHIDAVAVESGVPEQPFGSRNAGWRTESCRKCPPGKAGGGFLGGDRSGN